MEAMGGKQFAIKSLAWAGKLRYISVFGIPFCVACTPSVQVRTPDPLKVDMSVRLDIYQQQAPKSKGEELSIEVAASRRQRLGAILQLKADHIVGENRDGYLEMREPPKDPTQKDKAEKLIEAENSDRSVIYLNNSQTESKPLEEVEEYYSKIWTDRALPGEWIQTSTGQWKSK